MSVVTPFSGIAGTVPLAWIVGTSTANVFSVFTGTEPVGEPMVLDLRAPVSRKFYQASVGFYQASVGDPQDVRPEQDELVRAALEGSICG